MEKKIKDIVSSDLLKGNKLEDFCDLLNKYIAFLNESNKKQIIPFDLKRLLHYYINIDKKYIEFEIDKKSGGTRNIAAPDQYLLKIQRIISSIIHLYFVPTNVSHGFINERSIVTNAELHVNKQFVLNVDIADYFPSIHFARVKEILQQTPFFFNSEMATVIARFSTLKGKLPQGAATSPILSNIATMNLDNKLTIFAAKHKQTFSRYADDITFSGYRRIYSKDFFKELNSIVYQEQFKLKKSKTRIQTVNKRQVVTGITVNEKLNVNRSYIREVRAMIHHYKNGKGPENAFAVISGKLEFLKMVKGKDRVYKNLLIRFKK